MTEIGVMLEYCCLIGFSFNDLKNKSKACCADTREAFNNVNEKGLGESSFKSFLSKQATLKERRSLYTVSVSTAAAFPVHVALSHQDKLKFLPRQLAF